MGKVRFTANREPVHMGQTGSGEQRLLMSLRQHSQGPIRDRWNHFSGFGLRAVNGANPRLSEQQTPESRFTATNSQALDEIESMSIPLLEPRLNTQGPRWGEDTQEHFQYLKLEFGDAASANPEIRERHEKLDEIQQQLQELGQI